MHYYSIFMIFLFYLLNKYASNRGCTTGGDAGDASPPILRAGGIIPSNIFQQHFAKNYFYILLTSKT